MYPTCQTMTLAGQDAGQNHLDATLSIDNEAKVGHFKKSNRH